MLKRRSGKKYVRNGLLCIPEGYLAEKMAYIGEICARSGWIIIATQITAVIEQDRKILSKFFSSDWHQIRYQGIFDGPDQK